MCNGPLWNKILLFALPLMASSILQLLFNAADVVVVGRYAGKEALAAVGSNSALINLLINLFVGLSVGTNVVVARDLGAGRHDNVSRSVHSSITLALISGVGMAVFGVVMVRQLLEWMSSPPMSSTWPPSICASTFWVCPPICSITSARPSFGPRGTPSGPYTSSRRRAS